MERINNKKITCKICGDKFSTLTTHINRKHKMSVVDYLKRFPDAKTSSEAWRKSLSDTVKRRFVQDPTLRERVASRTFDFISNKELAQLLQRDYKSAKICLKYSLWKPSIILYGSIIEAVLMEKHPKSNDYYEAINIAYKKGDISERDFHKIQIIRDLRNFVHLHKELSEGAEIDESWAKTFADICESIIKRFHK